MEDEKLVTSVLKGDEHSFEILLLRHKNTVYNTAYGILRNYDDAMDITLETFYIAYTRLSSLKEKRKFRSWLIGIARNLSFMRVRERKRDISIEELKKGSVSTQFEENLIKEEIKTIVRREIEKLPHRYREPLIMQELNGLPYGKIANDLGISISNAKVRVTRARALLKSRLARVI